MRWSAPTSSCVLTAVLAGCGSAPVDELPPPAAAPPAPALTRPPAGDVRAAAVAATPATTRAPLADGRLEAELDGRARTLTIRDARTGERRATAAAGVGPTAVACLGAGRCYVADTRGDGLLVFLAEDGGRSLRLTRRVHLPGGPYGLALDRARRRLWVTAPGRNELALLPAHGRPHVLARYPTIRQPDTVRVDAASGAALVTSPSDARVQRVSP